MHTSGREDYIRRFKQLMVQCPDFHSEVLDASSSVNELTGKGRVWMIRTANNLPDGLRREAVAELTWERKEGDWYCTRMRGIRSFPWDANTSDVDDVSDSLG